MTSGSGSFSFSPGSFTFGQDDSLERDDLPDTGAPLHRKPTKRDLVRIRHREAIQDVLPDLPEPGASVHLVGRGNFDFWTWVPHLVSLTGPAAMWGSTWTMNQENALELLAMLDAGSITAASITTGLYFKRRESAVYATLLQGLQDRGQRYVAAKNHAKVLVLRNATADLVVEGSANFTANPRLEQYVVSRDPALAAFHVAWMEELIR